MDLLEKSRNTLELPAVLEMLAGEAVSEPAKAEALALVPSVHRAEVERLLAETSDAKDMMVYKGSPSLSGLRDVRGSLARADMGGVLNTRELLEIAGVLQSARAVRSYGMSAEKETCIDHLFKMLQTNRFLEDKIVNSIPGEDEIADSASSELSDIRRKMRAAAARVRDSLQKIISAPSMAKFLQDPIITTRSDRYVVPVKAECKGSVPGLVHDVSASGATLFVEPMAAVKANNEIRELKAKEKAEIERILAELSAECAAHREDIDADFSALVRLDGIFARAKLSFKLNAGAPELSERGVRLRRARHPLLDKDKAVPIDVELGEDYDTLVITGPNTGGKTVTLKTIGLLCLMAQCGLHIPAAEGSCVPIFDKILADIGDEQSIEQSLSTFSAHMVSIVDITKRAGRGSLVLFDELGAGTDPVEGAALAVSILERVRESGALCAATTHYAELKEFALDTYGVCNAGCEFDLESLRPTYRLIIGAPGKSNAFAISRKLGLDEEIVRRAESYVSGESRRFESVIAGLEESRADMERERAEAQRLREELESYKKTEEERLRVEYGRVERELERQRAIALGMVESAKSAGDYIMAELEEVKRHKDAADLGERMSAAKQNIRRRLRQVDNKINPVSEKVADEDYVLPRKLRAGDEVTVMSLGKSGEVVSVPDKGDSVTVKVGIITTRVPIKDLRLAEDNSSGFLITEDKKKKAIKPGTKELRTEAFSPEIDIRGETGEDGWFIVDRYLDDAKMAGVKTVTVVHGKGTGALKKALWQFLRSDRRVKSYRAGEYGEGDGGVTVIELK